MPAANTNAADAGSVFSLLLAAAQTGKRDDKNSDSNDAREEAPSQEMQQQQPAAANSMPAPGAAMVAGLAASQTADQTTATSSISAPPAVTDQDAAPAADAATQTDAAQANAQPSDAQPSVTDEDDSEETDLTAPAQQQTAPADTKRPAPRPAKAQVEAKAATADTPKSDDAAAVPMAFAPVPPSQPASPPKDEDGDDAAPALQATGKSAANTVPNAANGVQSKAQADTDAKPDAVKPADIAAANAAADTPKPAQPVQAPQPALPLAAPQAAAPAHDAPAVTQHVQVSAAHAAPDVPALAVQIAAKSQSGTRQFEIRLDPPELGRVEVRLSIDATGKASAHLSADQPQTLDLLRKDSTSLTQALRDAGLDVSQNGLNFSLRQQQGDNGSGQSRNPSGRALTATARLDSTASSSTAYRAPLDGRLDIRV